MSAQSGARRARRFSTLSTVAAVVLAYLAAAEVVLRFLPVATGLHSVAVDPAQPIFHFEPDFDFVYSHGWNLRDVVRGRVNNAGWVNGQDYAQADPAPLIAVVGDSYIEAQMLPYAETMQGRLAAALNGRFRVYSFAASGAPLSQFPVYAGYAVREFGASAVVINLANYDFAGGDAAYNRPAGMWVYEGGGDDRQLRLIPYHPGRLRAAVRYSALARYLLFNLRLDRPLTAARLVADLAPTRTAVAAEAGGTRLAAAEAVARAFFRDLPRLVNLPPARVLFVLDGFRYPERAAAEAGGYDDRLRRYFRALADTAGYGIVDLDPLFFARHRADGAIFEVPGDPHWNSAGHAVAAAAVLGSRLIADLPGPPR